MENKDGMTRQTATIIATDITKIAVEKCLISSPSKPEEFAENIAKFHTSLVHTLIALSKE